MELRYGLRFRRRGRPPSQSPSQRSDPRGELAQINIDHRRRVERDELRQQEAADDRDAERAAQLRSGTFSYGAPNVDVLTLPGEPTVAIYAWALCLPAVTIGAIGNVMHWLQRPLYRQADIFARPGTIGGMRFMRDTGFVASAFRTPDLWIYQHHLRSNFDYFSWEPFQ